VAPAAVAVTACLAACATTVDPDITAPPTGDTSPTTIFVATGTTAELLDQLLVEVEQLSEAIVDNEGQHAIVARVDVIWEEARPGVGEAAPETVREFDTVVDLLHRAVDRRRPADADRALINLRNLVAAFDP
jgi:hypothetical protein